MPDDDTPVVWAVAVTRTTYVPAVGDAVGGAGAVVVVEDDPVPPLPPQPPVLSTKAKARREIRARFERRLITVHPSRLTAPAADHGTGTCMGQFVGNALLDMRTTFAFVHRPVLANAMEYVAFTGLPGEGFTTPGATT